MTDIWLFQHTGQASTQESVALIKEVDQFVQAIRMGIHVVHEMNDLHDDAEKTAQETILQARS